MKIIRRDELTGQIREDGRIVTKYPSFDVNFKTKKVGLIKAVIPKGCKEKEHFHTQLDVICFYLTDAIVKVNSNEYEIKKGDILILHAGDRHHQIPIHNTIELIEINVPDNYDKVYTDDNNQSK